MPTHVLIVNVTTGNLRIVVCAAGPASDVGLLIQAAHDSSWTVDVAATQNALTHYDLSAVERMTGVPARTSDDSSHSGRRRVPAVDALIVAPATYNTVNKLASGVADTYVLTSVAELIGRGVPTVVVPFVNSALAGRVPFGRAVEALRAEGVRVVFGEQDGWEPHPPGSGAEQQSQFPWRRAFDLAVQLRDRQPDT